MTGSPWRLRPGVMLAALAACAGAATAVDCAPRTKSGAPDLEGVWTNASLASLERPAGLKSLEISEAEDALHRPRLAWSA
jgi:hypothetical protein